MVHEKKIAVYAGTFDPVTNGHLDILSRACSIFDEVVLGLAEEPHKKTLFTLEERIDLLKRVIQPHGYATRVRIESFRGLAVEFAQVCRAKTLVRGLRAISDFDYEFQMALMNRHQAPRIETVFLMPDEKFVYLSSSIVKEISRLKGNLRNFLPTPVIAALAKKKTPIDKLPLSRHNY